MLEGQRAATALADAGHLGPAPGHAERHVGAETRPPRPGPSTTRPSASTAAASAEPPPRPAPDRDALDQAHGGPAAGQPPGPGAPGCPGPSPRPAIPEPADLGRVPRGRRPPGSKVSSSARSTETISASRTCKPSARDPGDPERQGELGRGLHVTGPSPSRPPRPALRSIPGPRRQRWPQLPQRSRSSARASGSTPAAAKASGATTPARDSAQHLAPMGEPGPHHGRRGRRQATSGGVDGRAGGDARCAPGPTPPWDGGRRPTPARGPTTSACAVVGDLHRDGTVGRRGRHRRQSLAHLPLHHHQQRPDLRGLVEHAEHHRDGHVVGQVGHQDPRRPAPRPPARPEQRCPSRASRASASTTARRVRPRPGAATGTSRRSTSTATTRAPVSARATVSEPSPAPISTTARARRPRRPGGRCGAPCWGRRRSSARGPGWVAGRGRRAGAGRPTSRGSPGDGNGDHALAQVGDLREARGRQVDDPRRVRPPRGRRRCSRYWPR